jgi:microsomal epoxide hydrolase
MIDLTRRDIMVGSMLMMIPTAAGAAAKVRPFTVDIAQAKIEAIMARVASARLPREMPRDALDNGMDARWLASLREYWLDGFDWRKQEAALNWFPQFLTSIEGKDVHFYHVVGEGLNPHPLILTHGWPGSVREFLDVIDPLTHPSRHGGSAADAFTVVVPSLPGFAFSEVRDTPIQAKTTARLWHTLMTEVLGYRRYAAQGGDIGFSVTLYQAVDFPKSVSGIHINLATVPTPTKAQTTPAVAAWQKGADAYFAAQMDYLRLQMNKTASLAPALADSPMGTAAWISEKFWAWSDNDGRLENAISKDQLLTDIMLYLVTDSIDTSLWFYRAIRDEMKGEFHPGVRCTVPTAIAEFPKDYPMGHPPRALLDHWYNVVHFTRMPKGGHFAALEQPGLFVEDVRAGLRSSR